MPEIVGADGVRLGGNPTRKSALAGDAALDGCPPAGPALSALSQGKSPSSLLTDTAPMQEQDLYVSGGASGGSYEQEGGHDRCLSIRLGVPVQGESTLHINSRKKNCWQGTCL